MDIFHQPKIAMADAGIPIKPDPPPPPPPCYMCRSCRNNVLDGEHNIFEDADTGIFLSEHHPRNVRVDSGESDRYGGTEERPVLNVTCNDCGTILAAVILPADLMVDDYTYIFFLDKLLYWTGNQLVYADKQQRVEDN